MCTGLAGKHRLAEAIPPAATSPPPATAAQNGLHIASSLLVLFVGVCIAHRPAAVVPSAAQITSLPSHVDNPAHGVSFGAPSNRKMTRERKHRRNLGRPGWPPPRDKPRQIFLDSAPDKSWHGIVQQSLKRNDIRLVPYVSRSRADDADQEPARRSLLHDLSDRARGRGGRHRLRRVDGRHARRSADADLGLCHARQRAGLAGRCPTRSR